MKNGGGRLNWIKKFAGQKGEMGGGCGKRVRPYSLLWVASGRKRGSLKKDSKGGEGLCNPHQDPSTREPGRKRGLGDKKWLGTGGGGTEIRRGDWHKSHGEPRPSDGHWRKRVGKGRGKGRGQ